MHTINRKISSKYFMILLFSILLSIWTLDAQAQVHRFHPKETVQKLLQLRDNAPTRKIYVQGQFASKKHQDFVEYYLTQVLPTLNELQTLSHKGNILTILIDAAAYTDESEQARWLEELNELNSKYNEIEAKADWDQKISTAAQLADGLTGDLADEARIEFQKFSDQAFTKESLALSNELTKISNEYGLALNQSSKITLAQTATNAFTQVVNGFRAGRMSFEQAQKELDRFYSMGGSRFVAYDAHQKYPNHLNRAAVLFSKIALSKGHPTWASYRMANDAGYTEEYRGIETQRQFLLKVVSTLKPQLLSFIERRTSELGISRKDLKSHHLSLLFPEGLGVFIRHFPEDKIVKQWQRTMKESGFSDEILKQISVDELSRPLKNAQDAYMMPLKEPHLENTILDAKTLNFVNAEKISPAWSKGFVYILQTFDAGGVVELKTMFHEGGHALEVLTKAKSKNTPEAYAYRETPSITMENFVLQPDVLAAMATAADGQIPTVEELGEKAKTLQLSRLIHLLDTTNFALLDIDLWNYDYSAPNAMTFLERIKLLRDEMEFRSSGLPESSGPVPEFYDLLATQHFYSGAVRTIGYVLADMSSLLMSDYLSDELERTTGRRSWLNQPTLGPLFVDKFFSEGWKSQFPQNIEKITGRKFDPEAILKILIDQFSDCSKFLKGS